MTHHHTTTTPTHDTTALAEAMTHTPCCSSHGEPMTCEKYRRTHFVEVRPCCAIDRSTLETTALAATQRDELARVVAEAAGVSERERLQAELDRHEYDGDNMCKCGDSVGGTTDGTCWTIETNGHLADAILAAGYRKPGSSSEAIATERRSQIASGYDAAHDDKKGPWHLIQWAMHYAVRGEAIKATALLQAAAQSTARTGLTLEAKPRTVATVEQQAAGIRDEATQMEHRANRFIAQLVTERDAALAVIERAAKFEDTAHDMGFYRIVGEMRRILESAPTDALAEHDREVQAEALEAAAAHITDDYLARALRARAGGIRKAGN